MVYVVLITVLILIAVFSAFGGVKLSGLFYILTVLSGVVLLMLFKAFNATNAQMVEAQQAAEQLREKLPEMLRKQDEQKNET